jgi:ribosome maturation factor RimP
VAAEALVAPVVEAAGLDLVEVILHREAGRKVLRIVVDRDGGLDLDTI